MFQPKEHCSEHEVGYKLCIVYNKMQDKYFVTGYTQRVSLTRNTFIESDADGATLEFKTMEAAVASIVDYPDKKEK